jgi:hypothetical protein
VGADLAEADHHGVAALVFGFGGALDEGEPPCCCGGAAPCRPGKVSVERERRPESSAVGGMAPPPSLVRTYTGVTLDP